MRARIEICLTSLLRLACTILNARRNGAANQPLHQGRDPSDTASLQLSPTTRRSGLLSASVSRRARATPRAAITRSLRNAAIQREYVVLRGQHLGVIQSPMATPDRCCARRPPRGVARLLATQCVVHARRAAASPLSSLEPLPPPRHPAPRRSPSLRRAVGCEASRRVRSSCSQNDEPWPDGREPHIDTA